MNFSLRNVNELLYISRTRLLRNWTEPGQFVGWSFHVGHDPICSDYSAVFQVALQRTAFTCWLIVQKAVDYRMSRFCSGRRKRGHSPLWLAKSACKTQLRLLQNGVGVQLSPALFCLGNSLTIVLSPSKSSLSFSLHYHGYTVPNSLRSQVDDTTLGENMDQEEVVSLKQWLCTPTAMRGDCDIHRPSPRTFPLNIGVVPESCLYVLWFVRCSLNLKNSNTTP